MTLPQIKKMLKQEFNEKYLYNLSGEIKVERDTYATAVVKIQVGFTDYVLATFGLLDEKAQLDEKQFRAVERYTDKVVKSLGTVEEMDIKVTSNLREEYEL